MVSERTVRDLPIIHAKVVDVKFCLVTNVVGQNRSSEGRLGGV